MITIRAINCTLSSNLLRTSRLIGLASYVNGYGIYPTGFVFRMVGFCAFGETWGFAVKYEI